MTWMCGTCEKNNPSTLDRCKHCDGHWTVTWFQGRRKNRSQSRHGREKAPKEKRKPAPADSEKASPAPAPPTTAIAVSNHLPWVTSTPQSRNTARKVEVPSAAEPTLLPVPPGPPVKPPPNMKSADGVTSEELKLFEYLQGIRSLTQQLPEEFQQRYTELEAKIKANDPPTISHSQLNRMSRLRSQLSSAGKRVADLDQEWDHFAKDMMNTVLTHAAMYKQTRQDLLAAYQAKYQELQDAKKAIQEASQGLLQQSEMPDLKDELPDLEGQVGALQAALTTSQDGIQGIHLVDDDMDEMEAGAEDPDDGDSVELAANKPRPHTTFRASTSPRKVANQNLKDSQKSKK